MGNSGIISPGDVQWMTAGSGIIHQKMPKEDRSKLLWGFQLWANLPSAHKMMDPRYREVTSRQIPETTLKEGARVKIICGKVNGEQGSVRDIVTDPEYLDVTVPAGATINYAGGTFNTSASSSITGAGTLQVSGGTANLAGTVNVTGSNSFTAGIANLTGNYTCVSNTLLNIVGGTANFDGSGTVAPKILSLNGTLGGANTVTVGSAMNWSGGAMNGSGQTTIQPGAVLSIAAFTGYGGVYLTTRTLENSGTVVWGGGNFNMTGGVITNDVGASFQIQGSAAFVASEQVSNSPKNPSCCFILRSRTAWPR
jgi:hypothetical protein